MLISLPPYMCCYVQRLFPKDANIVHRINQYWPIITEWLTKYGASTNEDLVIYTLATIRAETRPVFSPGAEQPSTLSRMEHEGQIRPFGRYDVLGTTAQQQLGNVAAPEKYEQMLRARHGDAPKPDYNDGYSFRGRGFVQLTGRWNYTHMQGQLKAYIPGLDLVNKPDQAAEPDIAAQVIALWVAVWKKTQIQQAMKQKDYLAARHAVNKQGLNMPAFMAVITAHQSLRNGFEPGLHYPSKNLA